jgi:hypothetical protein
VVEEIRGGPPTPAAQMDVMDERFDLKTVNVKLREAITNCLENADDTTRKNDEAIADTQPDDPDDKDEHDNLQLRKQALIEAGVWNDAS